MTGALCAVMRDTLVGRGWSLGRGGLDGVVDRRSVHGRMTRRHLGYRHCQEKDRQEGEKPGSQQPASASREAGTLAWLVG